MPAKLQKLSIEPRIRFSYGRKLSFGPGKADLLEHIEHTGSISEAAKAMKMSYMRAWSLVKSMDQGFTESLVIKTRGGSNRGGATLSKTGRQVLALYREMEKMTDAAIQRTGEKLERLFRS